MAFLVKRLSAIWFHLEPIGVRRITYREVERQGEVPAVSLFESSLRYLAHINARAIYDG